jgi:alcohol dehydrogenase (cytochrome c)
VQALSAATGSLLWQYVRPLASEFNNGRDWRVKGVAIYEDKLYAPTADGHMIALDVKTGKVVWDQEIVTSAEIDRHGQQEGVAIHLDGGPIVAHGKVVIGVSLGTGNGKGGCFIVGLNAETGQEVWRFNTVAHPGQTGGDSWNGAPADQRYGGGVWTAGSYDPELNLVYFGTGNTYTTATLLVPNPEERPENYGLFTDSTLALNPDTGKLVWYYQHVHRDVWDLDWAFEQSLMTLRVDGKPRNLVVTAGKIAMFDALDRSTGEYVFSKDLGLQNLVIAVDPKTGKKTINPAVQPQAGKSALLCPNANGARNWPATSFNPESHIIYVPLVETCMDYSFTPKAEGPAGGGSDIRMISRIKPDSDGNFGRLEAIDLETKQVIWMRRQRAPISSSMLATAGGIVFNGDRDRFFRAYNDATGKILWQTRLNAVPSSSPVTYSINGQQYIAVVTGGGGAFDASGASLAPEAETPAGGNTLYVFKVPAASDLDWQ